MHLKRSALRNKYLLVHGMSPDYDARAMCLFRINEPLVALYELKTGYTPKPDYPKNFNFRDFFGEMEFSHSLDPKSERHVKWGSFAVLWNPAINRINLVRLPPKKNVFEMCELVSVGLGYDAVGDDYKIIIRTTYGGTL
ncbi:hypothetical protein POM88_044279 [Heracleum sosnowskyi]|uniref:Uncharacterized protein n=1 Tax=Heracleum sosnowskyi TaxID=360622 RepID=A0AAD8M2Q7_9APIA|nr:hypothetical protein POM88_044279 [Heracleum sosnowskyi]